MVERRRVVDELPLPLGPEAGILDALAVAVAVEDSCGVVLPDSAISVDRLRDPATVIETLDSITPPT